MDNNSKSIRNKLFQVIFGVTLVFILLTTLFTNSSYLSNMSEVYDQQYVHMLDTTAKAMSETAGYRSTNIEDATWVSTFMNTGLEIQNVMYLFNAQHQLIYSTDWSVNHRSSALNKNLYHELIQGHVMSTSKTNNARVLKDHDGTIYKTTMTSTGWTLILKVDKLAYYKKISSNLVWTLLFSLLCLGVSFFLAKVIAESLARPIIELKEVFIAAATGNMEIRADETGKDEIGIAGQGFNYFMDKINQMTYQDPLTGLVNYSGFIRSIEACKTNQQHDFGVLVFGVDGFKSINDTYGFEAGDQVLKFTALTTLAMMGNQMALFRLGGDEFGCLIHGADIEKRGEQLIHQLNDRFTKGMVLKDRTIYFTVTGGMSRSGYGVQQVVEHDLYKSAYLSLNRGKEKQKGCLHLFDKGLQKVYIEKVEISMMLREALDRNEFSLVMQPIFDTRTGLVKSAEFLIRWHSERLGFVSPDKFIPIAEENGMIVPIGTWILKESCKMLKTLQNQTGRRVFASVNISSVQIADPNFMNILKEAIQESEISATHLVLEITERLLLDDSSSVQTLLKEIKELGCRLALDDFGTGYSSLSYLSKYPIDIIKIDRSFVMTMKKNSPDANLVASIIQIAGSMQMTVIAEGVETEEQLALLDELKCVFIQGYLISKPINLSDFANLMDHYEKGVVAS